MKFKKKVIILKYIDVTTQSSLKHGVMELLNLSDSDMVQIFMSIKDTEKAPWEWVRTKMYGL